MVATDEPPADPDNALRIHQAFVTGDLDALKTAVTDATLIPNGAMPPAIGSCLVYAIYHSPLAFIRRLLELGADPNTPSDDGFPPLIAALSCTRAASGAARRKDVDEIVRLLVAQGADPNQRGINDYTALHMAVAEHNALAVQRLLDGGADPTLRTRIDACETPVEMARALGLEPIAAMLERAGRPLNQRLHSGVTLLVDVEGPGEIVRRQHRYLMRLRLALGDGTPVRWTQAWGSVDTARLEDEGATLMTAIRFSRQELVNGLFYGIDGMRVGGMRRLLLLPHVAYGDKGLPGLIPGGASVQAEITILDTAPWPA